MKTITFFLASNIWKLSCVLIALIVLHRIEGLIVVNEAFQNGVLDITGVIITSILMSIISFLVTRLQERVSFCGNQTSLLLVPTVSVGTR